MEEAALVIIIERLPTTTTAARLLDVMNEDIEATPERIAAVELAVDELTVVGLFVRDGSLLKPTPAAPGAPSLNLVCRRHRSPGRRIVWEEVEITRAGRPP